MRKLISTLTIAATLVTVTPALAASPGEPFVVRYDNQTHVVDRYQKKTIVPDIKRVQAHYEINEAYCATLPDNVAEGDTEKLKNDKRECRNFVDRADKNYGQVGKFVDQWYCYDAAKVGQHSDRCTPSRSLDLQTAGKMR